MRGTPPLDGPAAPFDDAPAAGAATVPTATATRARMGPAGLPGLTGMDWRTVLRRREAVVAIILVVGSLLFGLTHPAFLTFTNLSSILVNSAVVALVSVGMTMIIVTGGIDVSVGSTLGMGMLVAVNLELGGQNLLLVLLACVGVGLLIGLVNGSIVAFGGIHPIIVTLGMLNIVRALQIQFLGPLYITAPPTTQGRALALSAILGLPTPWWIAMVVGLIGSLFLLRRPLGRRIYALGGNPEAARLAGVNVRLVTIFVYAVTGLLVGLAAVIQLGLGGTVAASAGSGLELQVIAATVIGGTSVLGGRGTILGSILGALLVETVHNATIAIGTISLLDGLIVGVLIVLAVGLDVVQNRKATIV